MADTDSRATSLTLLGNLLDTSDRERREAAWRVFQTRYQPLIRSRLRKERCPDDAVDDLAAEVVKRVLTGLAGYQPAKGSFRTWLCAVVTNTLKSFGRSQERRALRGSDDSDIERRLEELQAPQISDSIAQDLFDRLDEEERQVITDVQSRVTEKVWQAFWLTYCEGRPAKEVAAQLGMKPGAVHQAVNRVGKMLKKKYAELVGISESEREDQA